jgi:hypothetical protein
MKTRGKPFEPGNKFGRGRPRGSRNKTTQMAQALMNEFAVPLLKTCIKGGLAREPKALQLCIERILPICKDLPVKIGKFPVKTAADLTNASELMLGKVAAGQISPSQGSAFAALIGGHRQTIETKEVFARLEALEARTI